MKFPENNFHFSLWCRLFLLLVLVSPLLVYVCVLFSSVAAATLLWSSSACLLLNLRAKLLSSTINRTSRMRILASDANMPSPDGSEKERRGKGENETASRLL